MSFEPGNDLASAPSAGQAFGPYLQAVRRHWKLVALVTVLAVLVSGVSLERATATYTTNASILVTPLPEGSAPGIATVVDTGDPARTVQTAAALVQSTNAAELTAKALGKPWTPQSVASAVQVAPEGASDVLDISGTASSPVEAARLADSYARHSVGYRGQVVQAQIGAAIAAIETRLTQLQTTHAPAAETSALATAAEQLRAVQGTGAEPTLSVSQPAQIPTAANGTSKVLVLLLALVGGFALASIAALGLETFSRPVRDRDEIEDLFPIPVMAALPRLSGKRRVHGVPPWMLPADAFEQLRMLRVQLSVTGAGQVTMVTSAGAGDGKTTVVAALAAAFAEAGESVALIDLDLRKPDLERLLQIKKPATAAAQSAGVPLSVPNLPGVQVLPTPAGDMSTVENVLKRLPLLIAQARRVANIVLVDTAPVGEVSEALRIAGMCDQVVFVARPRHTDRRRLKLARDLLDRAGARPVGMVLVGKETGLPRGDQNYAYAIAPLSGRPANGRPRPAKPRAGIVSHHGDAGEIHEHD